MKLRGGACEIVALVRVVLAVAFVVVAIGIVVLAVLIVVILVFLVIVALAIVEQLGASGGRVALELPQSENEHAALLALVAGAEQKYAVLLDHVQLLDLHGFVEDQSV